jgi:hypothetical protein
MLSLKPKQRQAIEAANDPRVSTIVLIGAVGTGKTDVAAHLSLSIAYGFPNTYWPVFRQNLSTAKRSVIPSYLNMLDLMNLEEKEDYVFNRQDQEIIFLHNKSKIGFIEADVTKDRQGRKIKGINATGNHIDEADELDQTLFITATSRRGRRNDFGQPSLSIVTMNPNDTHLRQLYYDPWRAGTLPADTVVIEFTVEDSWQSQRDIAQLFRNPKPWVERYLRNNWSYQDDADSLFKYRYFDAALTSELDNNALRSIGYDVARAGTDRSVNAMWYGNTLVDIQIVKDHDEQMGTDEQALWLIKFMTQNAVTKDQVSVDGVGVGVGVIDFMASRGLKPNVFVSGASPTEDVYDKLRSEMIYRFARGLEKGDIKIYEGCPFRNELISEAMAHNHKTTDKKLAVESKDDVKKRTGSLSPDIFDAVVMGLATQSNSQVKRNRLIF